MFVSKSRNLLPSDKLVILISKKEKAINDLDFENAEILQNEINKEKSKRAKDSFLKIIRDFEIQIKNCVSNSIDKLNETFLNIKKNEEIFNENFKNEFLNLELDFNNKKLLLENNLNENIKELKNNANLKKNELLEKAKKFAILSKFEEAKNYRFESEKIYDEYFNKLLLNLENEFNLKLNNLKNEFKLNKNNLKEKKYIKFQELKNLNLKLIDETKRESEYNLILLLNKNEVICNAQVATNLEKKEVLELLNKNFNEAKLSIINYNTNSLQMKLENNFIKAKDTFFITNFKNYSNSTNFKRNIPSTRKEKRFLFN